MKKKIMTIQKVITAFSFFYNNNVNFIEFIFKKSLSKKYYTHEIIQNV